ncbi:EamA/RhaT family transporter [Microbulbifer flavimaris]|uniref:EamA/RhaT family transporter n=1 Tax=Microbulbifer flavimaris TaxID=1781068 RepID=A0ABX4I304_9GAMM|nr:MULTISPECIES: DMT family transporter [Microbulbifer]KUJ84205.1 hypothetical protein AVO43_00365 [Microbulbifer sp. ZGT114]PCO06280.1 EamA/RhaT family transporter [Microbulbifer flavimaris]
MAGASPALVALAALCWGLSGGIAAVLIDGGRDPFVIAFYRGAVGFLLVLAWLCLRSRDSGLRNARLWCWSLLAGLGVAGNFAFYFISIAEGSVAVAVTLMYSAPVIVYLVSFVCGLESPTRGKLIAIALVMLGILLLTQVYHTRPDGITLLGLTTGLLAGLCYAVFLFGFKYAAPHGSPQAVLSIAFAVVPLTLLPRIAGTDPAIAMPGASEWPLLILLGVLGAGLSFALYVIGIKQVTPTVASIVAMIEPVTAALFGVVVLGESLATTQVVGILLILCTVVLLSVHSRAPRP